MKYKFFTGLDAESASIAYLAIERASGRKGYILRYRAGTIEVRTWA